MMELDEQKICFIICANNDLFVSECVRYIAELEIPAEMEVEILEIRDAASMTAGYNEAMNSSNAKYKVYLHQDVFVVNRRFVFDILSIFNSDKKIGMIGLVGNTKMPPNGIMWTTERVQYGNKNIPWGEYRYDLKDGLWEVDCIDGLLMATQYDIPWREELFDGWDFYDASQSYEMQKAGYKIVVPVQNYTWYIHDDKPVLQLWDYNKYRKIFLKEYGELHND